MKEKPTNNKFHEKPKFLAFLLSFRSSFTYFTDIMLVTYLSQKYTKWYETINKAVNWTIAMASCFILSGISYSSRRQCGVCGSFWPQQIVVHNLSLPLNVFDRW